MKPRPIRWFVACLVALVFGTLALGAPAASHDDGSGTIVEIDKPDELKPAVLQIAAGTTVTWVNKEDRTHRVRAATGTFDSGSLGKDATFNFRFDAAGTYSYSLGTLSNSSWSWWAGGTITVNGANPTPTPTAAPTEPPATQPTTGAAVSINDDFFTPATLNVAVGTTVVWTNRGGSKHTVTATGVFDSGVLSPGATFSFTFATPGTYRYVCEIHGGMTGTIVVGDGQTAAQPTPTAPAPTPTPVPTAIPQPSGAMVHILDNSYSPRTLTVPVGTTVTWMHTGTVKHTVTATGLFDSGILSPGATFRYTFTSPGTYTYRCELHSGMSGTIVVTGSGPTLAPTPPPVAAAPIVPAGAFEIAINDNSFGPASATVPVGTTVVWTNRGAVRHTVSGPGFSSGSIAAGGTFSFIFTAPGTYSYQCDFHAEMTGTIVVTGTASGSPVPVIAPIATPSPGPHPAAVPAGGLNIVIGDNVFNPGTTRVSVGTTVTWINHGRVRHTVTSETTVFDSGVMSPDGVFSVRFDTPGSYPYVCDIHPSMKGVIEVYGSNGAAPRATPLPSAAPTATATAPAAPTSAHVFINDNFFDAKEIRVTAGAEVTWMNHGVAKHTVTFTDGSGTSPLLATGQSWSHVFDKPGVYRYICALHPEMTGTVVVTEEVAATTSSGSSSVSTRATPQSAARAPESGTAVGLEAGILIGVVLGMMGAVVVGGPVFLALRRPA
jgi:plastocyanin